MSLTGESNASPMPESETVDPIEALVDLGACVASGELTVLVGNGASASAGLDVLGKLSGRLREALGKRGDGGDHALQLASMYVDEQHKSLLDRSAAKNRLIQLLESLLFAGSPNRDQPFGKIYPRLRDLAVTNFYTTNWDQIFYQCLMQDAETAISVERYDNRTVRHQLEPASPGSRHLVYLHGTVPGDPDQTIATSDECYQFEWLAKDVYRRLLAQFQRQTTLLAVGYSVGELRMLTYLKKARDKGHPRSRIFALMPALGPGVASELRERHGILTISLDFPDVSLEGAICSFLEALPRTARGEAAELIFPAENLGLEPTSLDVKTKENESPQSVIEQVERRMRSAGFSSVEDWFLNWPGRDALQPSPPPSHPLLETVYVERGLKDDLIADIEQGNQTGISGLLGIGGVGKSFLAMKIGQELFARDWGVVWVGLLDQSAEDAIVNLAAAYRLRFAENLRLDEQIVAVRILFQEVMLSGRRTLVILDNAERFPDLPLLLKALEGVPILVTSRTEECNDIVRYRRIESMTGEQSEELCRLYLNNYGSDYYDSRLDEEDKDDLRNLCVYLGGHPLGIRLVLAGFVRRLSHRRSEPRPFRGILHEIVEKGLVAIPPATELGVRAGETLHRTIFTTFEWLYRDLAKISPEIGPSAVQLLPVIAALGSVEIQKSSIVAAVARLRARVEAAIDPSKAIAEQQRQLQQQATATGPSFRTVGAFGLQRLMAPALPIKVPKHWLSFNEEEFLTLLGGSISLTRVEKKRIIEAIPRLSQYQIDELTKILKEERRKFSELDVKHLPQLRALEKKHAQEWEALSREMAAEQAPISMPADEAKDAESLEPEAKEKTSPEQPAVEDGARTAKAVSNPLSNILEPDPPADLVPQAPKPSTAVEEDKEKPHWFQALKALERESALDEALQLLLTVSLVEVDGREHSYGVHPLVREFSFEERGQASKGGPDPSDEPSDARLTASGPSLEAIYESALFVLAPSSEHGDSFLDLLPRLKGKRTLADEACRKILEGAYALFHRGHWLLLKQLLEEGVGLANDAGLKAVEGQMLCELGELLDRMEYADGISTMRSGVECLEKHGHRASGHRIKWAKAYLASSDCEVEAETHARKSFELLRSMLGGLSDVWDYPTIHLIEDHLRGHVSEGPSGLQMGLSAGSNNWLANSILDLSNWLDFQLDQGLTRESFSLVRRLYDSANQRVDSGESVDATISPQRHIELRLGLLVGRDLLEDLSEESLHKEFHQIQELARNAGIRGNWLLRGYLYHAWRRDVLAGRRRESVSSAKEYLAAFEDRQPANRHYYVLEAELKSALSQLVAGAGETESLRSDLDRIESDARKWGRNHLLGWLLLARAWLELRAPEFDQRFTVGRLAQARAAFRRQLGALPPEAEALYSAAREHIDRDGPQFDRLSDGLSEKEKRPPDYRPWLVQGRVTLPERVRSKVDGRAMRLVRGGLQTGPFGQEVWLYPFYCDEEPVTVTGLDAFFNGRGRSGLRLDDDAAEGPWAAGMGIEVAQEYAAWSGKQLPNSHEWFAVKWQHAAGHSPELWTDWTTASERMWARIETAVQGRVWQEMARLPGQVLTLPKDVPPVWLQTKIDQALSGDGLWEAEEFRQPLRALVQKALARSRFEPSDAPSREVMEELVRRLAAAPMLSLEDKKKILAKEDLSADEARSLLEALEEDRQNLEGREVYYRVANAQDLFAEWLVVRDPDFDAEALREYFSGGQLCKSTQLRKIFDRRVLGPLVVIEGRLSKEEVQELALRLAASLALELVEKERILLSAGELSEYQLRELLAMLRTEQEKLLEVAHRAESLRPGLTRKANEFLDWLYGDDDRSLYTGRNELLGVWSGMEGGTPLICRGDPFQSRLWIRGGMVASDIVDQNNVGIRCVLPIFTANDLDKVEAL